MRVCQKVSRVEKLKQKTRTSAKADVLVFFSVCDNADLLFALCFVRKADLTVLKSEKGIILSDADAFTREDRGAALSYDNVAGNDVRAVSLLDTEALRLTVTAVLRRTNALFMSKEL